MRNEGKGLSKNGPAIRPRLNSFDSLVFSGKKIFATGGFVGPYII